MTVVADLVAGPVEVVEYAVLHVSVVFDLLLVIPAHEGVLVAGGDVLAAADVARGVVEGLVGDRVVEVDLPGRHHRGRDPQSLQAVCLADVVDLRHRLEGELHVVERGGRFRVVQVVRVGADAAVAIFLLEACFRVGQVLDRHGRPDLLEESQRAELGSLLILRELGLGGLERGVRRVVGALRGGGGGSCCSGVRIGVGLGLLRRDKIRAGFR